MSGVDFRGNMVSTTATMKCSRIQGYQRQPDQREEAMLNLGLPPSQYKRVLDIEARKMLRALGWLPKPAGRGSSGVGLDYFYYVNKQAGEALQSTVRGQT
jgi:hypothetical protein